MKPKLYLETTVPSYLVGWPSRDLLVAAHQQITRDWWESRRTEFDLYASELVLTEVRVGDPQLANRRRGSWRVCHSYRSVTRYWNWPKT